MALLPKLPHQPQLLQTGNVYTAFYIYICVCVCVYYVILFPINFLVPACHLVILYLTQIVDFLVQFVWYLTYKMLVMSCCCIFSVFNYWSLFKMARFCILWTVCTALSFRYPNEWHGYI